MKHLPFQSAYRQDFEVVEQREGPLRLYPHTDQLPLLLRALNLEFYGALPGYLARVDHRGDGFHKILRKHAAITFCGMINAARPDQLRLYPLLDFDLVGRITVVQQMTRDTSRGPLHRFRFYGGDDFFPEIYLSGKRLLFADHVLQRFSTRVPNNLGEDLTFLLLTFYGCPVISVPVGPGRAFLVLYFESVLAFTYQETDTEFLITTCLTIHEMNSLSLELPPKTLNLHYGSTFTKPQVRNWLPPQWAVNLHSRWERKLPLPPPMQLPKGANWPYMACLIKETIIKEGHGPGSDLWFLDDIPGPADIEVRPGQINPQFRESQLQPSSPA